jgi:hypothetical protein
MKFKKSNDSVAEIMGTMLLLCIAVTLFSVISVNILSSTPYEKDPLVSVTGTVEADYVVITHKGGVKLSLETVVAITISGNLQNYTAMQLMDIESLQDGYWGVGERLVYDGIDLKGKKVEVTVVEPFTLRTIFVGILQNN